MGSRARPAVRGPAGDHGPVFFGRELADALAAELAAEPADVVVIDYLLRSAIGLAEQLATPVVLLIHTIYGFHGGAQDDDAARRRWFAPVNAARSQLGLPLLPVGPDSVTLALVRRAAGALVAVPREFDDWPDPPANVVHVGWITEEAEGADWASPWPPDDRRPLVVVSLGTTYMRHEQVLGRIVQALDGMAARPRPDWLGARAGRGAFLAGSRGSGIRAARRRPARRLARRDARGDGNAAGRLLGRRSRSLPPARPRPARQPRRVEDLGLGRVLSADAAAATIRESIFETLASSELPDRAARMAAVIRGYDGGTRAVTMLERFAASGVITREL